MKNSRLASRDLWLVLSACTTGASLVIGLWLPVGWVTKVCVLGAGTVLALLYLVMWKVSRKHSAQHSELTLLKETVIVDAGGSAEILFAPPAAIVNPKLVMTAHGHSVKVEDIWHAGISVVSDRGPSGHRPSGRRPSVERSILYWHRGVMYSGHIDTIQPLKILLRNEDRVPVSVQASIVIPSKE